MNQKEIEFSVIIPLYNKKSSIIRTIQSVLLQDYTNFEIIVIDDGSTDGSSELLEKIEDHRILIYKKENTGVSDTRNIGIKKAKGKFIAFLDADDIWDNLYLQRLHDMIVYAPDCGMYAQNFEVTPVENIKANNTTEQYTKAEYEVYSDWERVFFEKTFRTSAIAVNKNKFIECGGFDPSLTIGEDLEAWLRIALRHPVCYLNECHVKIVFYSKAYHSRIVPKDFHKHYSYKLIKERGTYLNEKDNIYVKRLLNKAIFYAYLNFSWDRNKEAKKFLKDEFKFKYLNKKDRIKFVLFQLGCLKYMVKRG